MSMLAGASRLLKVASAWCLRLHRLKTGRFDVDLTLDHLDFVAKLPFNRQRSNVTTREGTRCSATLAGASGEGARSV